jgi:hypothetical protein
MGIKRSAMIARVWHGVAPATKASDHSAYIQQELLERYLKAPGNQGAFVLSRMRDGGMEFMVLSLWESVTFLEALTGPDVEGAIATELIHPPPMIKNYEVVVSRDVAQNVHRRCIC